MRICRAFITPTITNYAISIILNHSEMMIESLFNSIYISHCVFSYELPLFFGKVSSCPALSAPGSNDRPRDNSKLKLIRDLRGTRLQLLRSITISTTRFCSSSSASEIRSFCRPVKTKYIRWSETIFPTIVSSNG